MALEVLVVVALPTMVVPEPAALKSTPWHSSLPPLDSVHRNKVFGDVPSRAEAVLVQRKNVPPISIYCAVPPKETVVSSSTTIAATAAPMSMIAVLVLGSLSEHPINLKYELDVFGSVMPAVAVVVPAENIIP